MASANTSAKAYRAGQEAMLRGDYKSAETSFMWASTMEPENAMYLHAAAGAFCRLGDYHEAEELYRKSITCAEDSVGTGHPLVAVTAYSLVELYEEQERYDEARLLSMRVTGALDRREAVHTNRRNLSRLAHLFVKADRRADGERLLREALAYRKKIFGIGHSKVATCRTVLREFLSASGAPERAGLA